MPWVQPYRSISLYTAASLQRRTFSPLEYIIIIIFIIIIIIFITLAYTIESMPRMSLMGTTQWDAGPESVIRDCVSEC